MEIDTKNLSLLIEAGNVRALARAISLVENHAPEAIDLIKTVYRHTGRAHVIGITGPPGAGKSTLVGKLATQLRVSEKTVAILAIDPSSPFTGGAVLGDRVRMHTAMSDPSIFVRSLASRGHVGGVSLATSNVLVLLDAARFDFVLIETVGAGQSEIEIMDLAHTVTVILAPGMGDEVQAIKAGILEIGDILVVNKADRPDAVQTARQIRSAMGFTHMGKEGLNCWPEDEPTPQKRRATLTRSPCATSHMRSMFQRENTSKGNPLDDVTHHITTEAFTGNRYGSAQPGCMSWHPPVVKTIATTDEGIIELANRIIEHRLFLEETGQWECRRKLGIIAKFEDQVKFEATQAVLRRAYDVGLLQQLLVKLEDYSLDPYTAAELFVRTLLT